MASVMTSGLLRGIALGGLLALQCWPSAWAQPRFGFDAAPGVLSKQVRPTRYELSLQLDPEQEHFSGRVAIHVQVDQPTEAIVLHAHELQSLAVVLKAPGRPRPMVVRAAASSQTWRLTPSDRRPIAAGKHVIELDYIGKVRRSGEAMYRSEYIVGGQRQRMLATQMQAVFARSVFPGFDEPAFRAEFDIAVRAPKDLQVVSNMPLLERTEEAGTAVHRFAATPSMPTYLVAVAVGRFDMLEGHAGAVPLRMLGAPGKREQAAYALRVTEQVLPFFAEYFGLPFALPKLDQLAVPSGRNGAMEDWGLISYAESTLHFDPARSSPRTKRDVFERVAHEVAHQWFGNLVTAASWDEIWLNEAFATWLARKATASFNPGWNIALGHRVNIDQTMSRDAGTATRAIRAAVPVAESRVLDVFDSVTYTKGGAVLAMLEQWIGPEAFRRGLAAYIADRKYSNATAGDLWHHLSEASGRDVSVMAASWTDQTGFPLVEVRTRCEEGSSRITLSQRQFTFAPLEGRERVWKIPVRLSRGEQATTFMLDVPQATTELPGCRDEPVLVNAGAVGFYRVDHGPAAWPRWLERFVRLPAPEQVALLSDSFALVQAGRMPMTSYFQLLAMIPNVHGAGRATLFTLAGAALEYLDDTLAGSAAQGAVRRAARLLLAPELARLGWQDQAGDDAETPDMRGTLVAQLARFDDGDTVARARQLFEQDVAGRAALPPTLRSAVIEVVGMHADGTDFERLLSQLKAATSEEDRLLLARALASGRHAGRAQLLLDASLGGITAPDIAVAIPALVAESSPFGELAYQFTLQHWDQLVGLVGAEWSGRAWLLPSTAARFNDPATARRLTVDQRRKLGREGDVPAARIGADIALRVAVRRREGKALEELLSDWRPQD
jgi:aminopeptidase N